MARELTETLEEAQKYGLIKFPYLIAKIRRKWGGIIRYEFESLYSGAEPDDLHTAAIPNGDGSLIRLRVDTSDNKKLYYQRVTNPGPESDFSAWTYLSIYDVIAVASCAYGANVFQVYVNGSRQLYVRESADSGASWGSWTYLGLTSTISIHGFSAAYKPNGDIGMFWIDGANIYRSRRIAGEWEEPAAWDKTTGDLSGVAVIYNEDWELAVTGKDSSNQWSVWSIVYGDGNRVSSGTWSDLEVILQRGTTEPYEYHAPFMIRTDTTRLYFVEKYTGT